MVPVIFRIAWSSVLNQSFDSWEHIIIDCGSTDNSRKVLESLKHPRLRVIHEEFCGVARARNRAIQQARGEFCAILDADDRALPDRLRLQVELLRKDKALVAVGGNAQRICSSHRTVEINFSKTPMDDPVSFGA